MTDLPIPAVAEGPCPKCRGTLKIVPGTVRVEGLFAIVHLACGCKHQAEYAWQWADSE